MKSQKIIALILAYFIPPHKSGLACDPGLVKSGLHHDMVSELYLTNTSLKGHNMMRFTRHS